MDALDCQSLHFFALGPVLASILMLASLRIAEETGFDQGVGHLLDGGGVRRGDLNGRLALVDLAFAPSTVETTLFAAFDATIAAKVDIGDFDGDIRPRQSEPGQNTATMESNRDFIIRQF